MKDGTRNQDLSTRCAHCYWGVITFKPSQMTEQRNKCVCSGRRTVYHKISCRAESRILSFTCDAILREWLLFGRFEAPTICREKEVINLAAPYFSLRSCASLSRNHRGLVHEWIYHENPQKVSGSLLLIVWVVHPITVQGQGCLIQVN